MLESLFVVEARTDTYNYRDQLGIDPGRAKWITDYIDNILSRANGEMTLVRAGSIASREMQNANELVFMGMHLGKVFQKKRHLKEPPTISVNIQMADKDSVKQAVRELREEELHTNKFNQN